MDFFCFVWTHYAYYYLIPFFVMPPPLGAGGIMFSGCPSVRPSVRSLKYPLLTCTWVRWSTRPTVTVLRHVCPSVRPSVRLSVRPSGEVSGHLPENALRDWPEIWYADVSWPSSELISLWLWSVDFSNFGTILTSVAYQYRKSISIIELFVSIISIYIGFLATFFSDLYRNLPGGR